LVSNERGQVVGTSTTASGEDHAFLWAKGKMIDLGTPLGTRSGATSINAHGQIVGYSAPEAGGGHAFLWEKSESIDLGTFGQ
jgi:probable HAF family extracellular repeat protein